MRRASGSCAPCANWATRPTCRRSLAAAQHTRIALIYTNPSAAYLQRVAGGCACRRAPGHPAGNRHLGLHDHEARAGGARSSRKAWPASILPPPLCESKVVLSELAAAGIPVVAIASGRFQPDLSSVRIDDFRASQEMAEHLIAHGSCAHRVHPRPSESDGERAALRWVPRGYDSGRAHIDPRWSSRAITPTAPGWRRPKSCSTRNDPPTAIFASNDDMAAAAVSVAHRRGLDVPRDLSVVGFDDTPTATTVWPELTTVRQPIAAMAGSAIELLLRSIRQRKDGEARVVSDHVMAHVLIKRDSVAAPRKG